MLISNCSLSLFHWTSWLRYWTDFDETVMKRKFLNVNFCWLYTKWFTFFQFVNNVNLNYFAKSATNSLVLYRPNWLDKSLKSSYEFIPNIFLEILKVCKKFNKLENFNFWLNLQKLLWKDTAMCCCILKNWLTYIQNRHFILKSVNKHKTQSDLRFMEYHRFPNLGLIQLKSDNFFGYFIAIL